LDGGRERKVWAVDVKGEVGLWKAVVLRMERRQMMTAD